MGKAIRELAQSNPSITFHDFKLNTVNFPKPSLVMDFSSPDCLSGILEVCIAQKLSLLTGTTGFTSQHHEALKKAQEIIPILVASNMSIGIASLKKSIEKFLTTSQEPLLCNLLEIHHTKKLDAPSGTALEILRFLEKFPENKIKAPISVKSHRFGNVFGIHRVEFQSSKETIFFQHIANSRDIFAAGAIAAAEWVESNQPGLYSFGDFLAKKL